MTELTERRSVEPTQRPIAEPTNGHDLLAGTLKRLGLTTLATAAPGLLETARQQQWPYETFLQQALGAELQGRAQRAYERRVHAAHLPASAVSISLDSFDFGFQPMLSERLIRELATLGFLETATNLIFLGPPGVGKTHLALALLARTLDARHAARFTTLRQLADERRPVGGCNDGAI